MGAGICFCARSNRSPRSTDGGSRACEQCLRIYSAGRGCGAFRIRASARVFCIFRGCLPRRTWKRERFSWIEELEAQTDAIRAELRNCCPAQGRERVFTSDEVERQNLRGYQPRLAGTVITSIAMASGARKIALAARSTDRALQALPLGYLQEHGPEVLFSVFTPGTHLLPTPRRDQYAGRSPSATHRARGLRAECRWRAARLAAR